MNLPRSLALMLALMPITVLAQSLAPDTVVARRGGVSMTVRDVDARLAEVPEDKRTELVGSPKHVEKMLSDLLLVKQLATEARAQSVESDPAYQDALALYAERLQAAWQRENLLKTAPKGDFDAIAKERYLSEPERFAEPAAVTVRHILIRTGGSGCRSEEQAQTLAEKVRAEAAAGKDFAELVATYSEDETTKSKGGDLPTIKPGRSVPAFETAALELTKPGEISPVVHTKFGYHVIALVSREESRPRSFEQVKERLSKQLAKEQASRYQQNHLDGLRSMSVEADPKTLSALMDRYVPAAPKTSAEEPSEAKDSEADPAGRK